jgi:hypothetical protein
MLSDVLVRFIVLVYMTDHKKPRKKATEVAFFEFLLRGMSYPSCLTQAAMRKLSSFAFILFCFFN